MRIFCTREKLAEFVSEIPDDADVLLQLASLLAARETRAALYDTDPAGMPTDPDVIDAMAEAVAVQVREWVQSGVDPVAGYLGTKGEVASSSIDGASVSFATKDSESVRLALSSLCPMAVAVLADAGLVGGLPWAY
ncbi:hypothetical protein HW450_06760 [Corynebacterium hindlerae]|uniref:Head-to-tail adaptor n=1 Tax=Corynebacterium hindlerae TaxID=699041 RepID=A0A7G5FBV0_9CORY|nr:hypothetical protein [Corynebacterium hindlerae]QMV84091.1 hypothetical protein HW450_06760 [Corynebacterium hindlerae]